MRQPRSPSDAGSRLTLHLPPVSRTVPYWARLIPPGELPRRAVIVRLVLALVLAIGLWVVVSNGENPVDTVPYHAVPVTVKNPPGYYPKQQPPPVSVQVRGLRSDVKDMPRPVAFVDLRKIPLTAKGPFPIQVSVPPGVEVTRVNPRAVYLPLEKQLRKTIRVLVQPFAAPPPGYVASQPVVSPDRVEITGPSETVKNITNALVTVDESALRGDETLVREPTVYNRNGHPVSRHIVLIRPSTVTIRLHVSLQQYPQLVPIIPDIRGAVASGYRISRVTVLPPLVSVESTTPGVVASLATASIDVSRWTASQTVQAPLVVPSGLTLRQHAPATVTVDVVPVQGSAVSVAGILTVGKRPGTTVTLTPSKVTVDYQGPIPTLNAAQAPQAVIDLQERPPGVYYLTPRIVLAHGLSPLDVLPRRVRVVITAPAKSAVTPPAPTRTPTPRPTATVRPKPPAPRPTTHPSALPASFLFRR